MKRALDSDSPKSETSFLVTFEEKVKRNREKNREHARQTRIRRKERSEGLRVHLLQLQREFIHLEQTIEKNDVASILLCLGGNKADFPQESSFLTGSLGFLKTENLFDLLKQEARDEAAVNYAKDEFLPSSDDPEERDDDSLNPELKTASLSSTEDTSDVLLSRKAKNRIHAKLTRDRKRLLLKKMTDAIAILEIRNEEMKARLECLRGLSSDASIKVSSFPLTYSVVCNDRR